MDLDATRGVRGISGADLVAAEELAGRGVQLVVVDLDGRESHVERQLDVGGEGHVLHDGGQRVMGVAVERRVVAAAREE